MRQISVKQSPKCDVLFDGYFLKALRDNGIDIYAASGTDHCDVVSECKALGLYTYFKKIAGAPDKVADCSKEAVIKDLIENSGFSGEQLMVVGDGKVEIALGKAAGAFAVGVASDEEKRRGINSVKERRLKAAGADLIIGDFSNLDELMERVENGR